MKKKSISKYLVLGVKITSALIALLLVTLYFTGNLGEQPILRAQRLSGDIALTLLLLSLSITPLRTLTGINSIAPLRRAFGLNAFYFAALHVLVFIGLNYSFNFSGILEALGYRKFILAGLVAFLILLVMSVTSIRSVKLAVKKSWKRIHSFVYLAGSLVILHYLWGSIVNLQGQAGWLVKPVVAGVVLVVLLALRIKPVKEAILRTRASARPGND